MISNQSLEKERYYSQDSRFGSSLTGSRPRLGVCVWLPAKFDVSGDRPRKTSAETLVFALVFCGCEEAEVGGSRVAKAKSIILIGGSSDEVDAWVTLLPLEEPSPGSDALGCEDIVDY